MELSIFLIRCSRTFDELSFYLSIKQMGIICTEWTLPSLKVILFWRFLFSYPGLSIIFSELWNRQGRAVRKLKWKPFETHAKKLKCFLWDQLPLLSVNVDKTFQNKAVWVSFTLLSALSALKPRKKDLCNYKPRFDLNIALRLTACSDYGQLCCIGFTLH